MLSVKDDITKVKPVVRKVCAFTLFLAAITVSAMMFSSTGTSQASTPMLNGVLAHSLSEAQASTLAANGINWVRSDVSLRRDSNWYTIYQLAKEYNLSLIGTLAPYTMGFSDSADWQQTVQSAVNLYGDEVSVWEIWNEPTIPNARCGPYQGTAQQYVDLMKTAYQVIKAAYPDAVVLGLGGLPLYSGGEPYLTNSLNFAREVSALGGMSYCDAISLHAYPYGSSRRYVQNYQASLDKYVEITGKDVWITETGQESAKNYPDGRVDYGFDEPAQAGYLVESYPLLKSKGVKAYIWYELNDNNPGNSADFQNISTFGLYNINSNPKQALTTYFEVVRNSTPTPTELPSPQVDSWGNNLIWYFAVAALAIVAVFILCWYKKRTR